MATKTPSKHKMGTWSASNARNGTVTYLASREATTLATDLEDT